jgi:hypothetical protein
MYIFITLWFVNVLKCKVLKSFERKHIYVRKKRKLN